MTAMGGCEGRMLEAVEELLVTWEASGADWRDQARAAFAAEHLRPLVDAARTAAAEMAELSGLLHRVRWACA